jgi:Zn-finger nucleic acid-binding protein
MAASIHETRLQFQMSLTPLRNCHIIRVMIAVCPRCDVGMLLLHFKEVEVDYCDRCRGIWLDAGELETLLRTTGSQTNDPFLRLLDQAGTPSPAARCLCPRCDSKLNEFTASDLVLDHCPRGHGLWFDADELQQLLTMSGASNAVAFLNDLFGNKPTTKTEETQP